MLRAYPLLRFFVRFIKSYRALLTFGYQKYSSYPHSIKFLSLYPHIRLILLFIMYAFKECSSCGALYNKDHCCFVDTFVRDPNETPDSSKQSLLNCPTCGDAVDGLYCRPCAFVRKCLNEVCFASSDENESFKNLLNPPHQTQTHSSDSSNDNTNFVDTPQEPIVENQDPGENFTQNSLQSPPQITQNCCYGCGDSLDDFFCQRCTCESCGNGAHYGYNCPPQVPIISNPEPCYNQNFDEFPKTSPSFQQQYLYYTCQRTRREANCEEQVAKARYWKIPICNDDDEEYTFAITPVLPTNEPDKSLSMRDEHLSAILKTESDELIKSSNENLVPIPSESGDFSDIKSECDVPDCDDSQTTKFSTFSNPLFDDSTSSDDESRHEEFNPIHNEDLDSTLKNDRFDTESYLLESLLNRDTLMASSPKIDSLFDEFAGELITIPPRIVNREHEEYISLMERLLYDNSSPRPPEDFHANPNTIIESLPTFPIPVEDSDSLREEIDIFPGPDDSIPPGIESDDYDSEGDDNSTSLPEFESFHVDYPDSGDSTIDVVEDIPVDVPNILPTHPTLHMDFDFIPSHNDLGSDLDVSSPSGDRNKIYDPGICIEVESTRFLATLSPVIDTLLPFSSENKDKVFNHDVLASKEKSPPSSSHWGFKASKLFHHKSPMLNSWEDNTPDLGVSSSPDSIAP
ncbi:hypothetical protein Tco_1229309 [Tanacetum coccineum]